MKAQNNKIKEGLQHFHGSAVRYRIPLLRTHYTNGIQYLAKTADCYWLVTDVSVIAKSLMDQSYFITIDFRKLSKEEQTEFGYDAMIKYSDGNGNTLETQRYHLSDFPLEELRLFFVNNTLLLPSEY